MKRLVLVLALLASASADVVSFSDRSSWSSAAGTVTNTSFNSLVPSTGGGYLLLGYTPPPFVVGDASYMATSVYSVNGNDYINSYVFLVTPEYGNGILSPGGYTSLMTATEYDYGSEGNIHGGLEITFGSGHHAAGLNLDTYFVGAPYIITLSNGQSFTLQAGGNSSIFFGFVSDDLITSVYIRSYSDSGSFGIGEMSYDATSAVPEPGTLLLVGSGLLAGMRRFRK